MSKDSYIWLDGEKIYVSEEVYRAYYRPVWREAKQKEVRGDMESSYDFMLEHDFDGQAAEDQTLVDEIVVDKLLLDELYAALAELTDDTASAGLCQFQLHALGQSAAEHPHFLTLGQQYQPEEKPKAALPLGKLHHLRHMALKIFRYVLL